MKLSNFRKADIPFEMNWISAFSLFIPIVGSTLCDQDSIMTDSIYNPVTVIDAPTSVSGKITGLLRMRNFYKNLAPLHEL